MNPPPFQQPQPPAQNVVVIQQKSGCGKALLICGIIAGVCALLVGGCFVMGVTGVAKAVDKAEKERLAKEKLERETPPEIAPIPWTEIASTYGIGSTSTDLARDEKWKTYKGKVIQWTGTVVDATKNFSGSYLLNVKMEPATLTYDVAVTLRDDQGPAAANLKKGDTVTFQAKLERWGSLLPITAEKGVIVH